MVERRIVSCIIVVPESDESGLYLVARENNMLLRAQNNAQKTHFVIVGE